MYDVFPVGCDTFALLKRNGFICFALKPFLNIFRWRRLNYFDEFRSEFFSVLSFNAIAGKSMKSAILTSEKKYYCI
jgi:hypothetical protein